MKKEERLENFLNELEPFLILVIICSFVGVVSGILGALFLKTIDVFTSFRNSFVYLIFGMPFIGLFIIYLNNKYKYSNLESETVNKAINNNEDIPKHTILSLFITTCLSHLVGASVGRLEAPVEMGGAVGNHISNFFDLKNKYRKTTIASGVAALFGCIFGAPVTGTVFALELLNLKNNKKDLFIVPVLLAACFSRFICFAFGANSFVDTIIFMNHANYSIRDIFFILVLIFACIVFSLFYNYIFDRIKSLFFKVKNEYIRIIVGSIVMIGFYFVVNDSLLLGNNTTLIKRAMINNSMWYSFIIKMILTSLCVSIGFKGGKIGPSFVIGSCFGILIGSFMGIDLVMSACIGALCILGSITGFYISIVVLGIELFGFKALLFYIIIAMAIRYLFNKKYIKRGI